MGKSPGKWIKMVLFGKKSSKSNFSKDIMIERKTSITAKAPSGDMMVGPPVISDPLPQTTDIRSEHIEIEKGSTANLPRGTVAILPEIQGADGKANTGSNSANKAELNRLEQAASKAQAAFRGYLARRAFRALKGIIRLQALVRGHLVRRQAVATLRCMEAIVKFQALVRGRSVRLSDVGLEVLKKCSLGEPLDVKRVDVLGINTSLRSKRLLTNAFVCKLLASSPAVMPLSLQYDVAEPNSAWNWLERWSLSRFWEPIVRQKKILDGKPKRKQANMQTEEVEPARPKRGVWKTASKNADNNSSHSSEYEKPKRNPRKVLIHQAEPVQEQPQIELEKVKRNLRKISVSTSVASDRSVPPTNEVSGKGMDQVYDNLGESTVAVSNQPVLETPPKPLAVDKPLDAAPHDDRPADEIHSIENGGKVEMGPTVNEDISTKDNQTGKENQKARRRRSFPAKQEFPESASPNGPTLPSYMAATESAKAKLRAQELAKFGEDGAENGSARRHSLPSSTNGKMSSPSPRIQKPVQANGKGGIKNNKSLTVSRDEKVVQTGWRR